LRCQLATTEKEEKPFLHQVAAILLVHTSAHYGSVLTVMGFTSYGDRITSSAVVVVVVATAIILLAANITITNAQQQQSLTSQTPPATAVTQNGTTTLFQSAEDSIRLMVPEGWVIQDVNNTGFTLAAEVLQGYGILAQLCPQEQEQQGQSVLTNVGGINNAHIGSCQHAPEEVIHIIRYPNLGARLGISFDDDIFTIINGDTIPNAILAYHMQKLQEVGYRDIQIVNSTDDTIIVDISRGTDDNNNNTLTAAIPAKLVEMTYSTSFAPDKTKRGYFFLTVTAATPRNLGMITGYSIFYEGNSAGTTLSGGLVPTSTPLQMPVRQVFDSFELIAAVPTESLIVEITSDDTQGVAPATFEFEADLAGGLEPYTIRWDFSDDGSSEESDRDVEHTFEEAGTYNVDLIVTDSIGQSASDSMEITVEEPPAEEEIEEVDEVEPIAADEVEEDNNLGSDDLFDVDDFLDDLFDRLGPR